MDSTLKLKGEKFECFNLDWDTNYFGVNSARVILEGAISEADQDRILEYCKSYEFITITNKDNLKENNHWIGTRTNAFLTDINIQFIKRISEGSVFNDEQTEIYNSYKIDEKVVNIARSSFQHSRFFNDPALPEEKAKNIYLHWTKCAFEQENKYFALAKKDDGIAGYILFSINSEESNATIELIAVDDRYQGKGIGKSLISKLEAFVYKHNIKEIKVGTQINNRNAMQFYLSCNYKYMECSSVYHLWID